MRACTSCARPSLPSYARRESRCRAIPRSSSRAAVAGCRTSAAPGGSRATYWPAAASALPAHACTCSEARAPAARRDVRIRRRPTAATRSRRSSIHAVPLTFASGVRACASSRRGRAACRWWRHQRPRRTWAPRMAASCCGRTRRTDSWKRSAGRGPRPAPSSGRARAAAVPPRPARRRGRPRGRVRQSRLGADQKTGPGAPAALSAPVALEHFGRRAVRDQLAGLRSQTQRRQWVRIASEGADQQHGGARGLQRLQPLLACRRRVQSPTARNSSSTSSTSGVRR